MTDTNSKLTYKNHRGTMTPSQVRDAMKRENLSSEQIQLMTDFVRTAVLNQFDSVVTCIEIPGCGVWLADGSGTDIPCLAVAHDAGLNSWTVLTRDGKVREYLDGEIL